MKNIEIPELKIHKTETEEALAEQIKVFEEWSMKKEREQRRQRLLEEHNYLLDRLSRLSAFIGSKEEKDEEVNDILYAQYRAMNDYAETLVERLLEGVY